MRHPFPRHFRLTRQSEFDAVFARRLRLSDRRMTVLAARNGLTHSRLGLIVSRKVGKAVLRNRWKRLFREAFRLSSGRIPAGFDFIVMPGREPRPSLAGVTDSIVTLSARLARKLNLKDGG